MWNAATKKAGVSHHNYEETSAFSLLVYKVTISLGAAVF